ncbi:MAG TPA: cytochrome c biogenesis protein CcdA, partial [Thermoplasmata archaeon]|nr:cytochrome c biogenesis protein CcdA [Thermoplasmata archaeon]
MRVELERTSLAASPKAGHGGSGSGRIRAETRGHGAPFRAAAFALAGPERSRRMRSQRRVAVPALAIALVAVASLVGLGQVLPGAQGASATADLAPNFTLPDIYGHNFTLSSYRNTSVVVIEFTSISCSECQIVEQSLKSIYSTYNATGTSRVQMISVFTQPGFGDTIPVLRAYHLQNDITWVMAQDTLSGTVQTAYAAEAIPVVVVVNEHGQAVYKDAGAQSEGQLRSSINSALAGTASTISIVTVSVFLLAAVAGVSTFFSPCAFPMFPGYMGLFLGLNATGTVAQANAAGTYKGAARRALVAGSVTALGMVIVFLLVGVALVVAANKIVTYIPDLLIVVGGILVVLGALLLTNLQYWRIVAPLQNLWGRITRRSAGEAAVTSAPSEGRGFHLKLFSYGMGYAAAAAGCVAPVIFSAIVAGLAL